MQSKHENGFTLIELLLVIAIIAILAAVLLLALTRAKVNFPQDGCTSYMRQTLCSDGRVVTMKVNTKGGF